MKIKSEKDVESLAKAGVARRVYVGDGLYVKVGKRGTLSWLYQWHAKPGVLRGPWARGMGGGTRVLGHWPGMALEDAREVAAALERVRRERGPEAIPDAVEEVLREMHSHQCAGSIVARGEDPEEVEAAPLGVATEAAEAAPPGAATEAAEAAPPGAATEAPDAAREVIREAREALDAASEVIREAREAAEALDAVREVIREAREAAEEARELARDSTRREQRAMEAMRRGVVEAREAAEEARGAADGAPSRAALAAVDTLMSAALSMLGSARALLALGVPSEALGASYEAPPCGCGNKIEVTPKVRK